jgi:hypothetical protein
MTQEDDMTADQTGEVYVLTSRAHPDMVRIDWSLNAGKALVFFQTSSPKEENYKMPFVRRVPDAALVVQRVRDALVERNSSSACWYEINEAAAVALVRDQIVIWFESPQGDKP